MECPDVAGNPVEQYLVHSYIYYELNDQIITDWEYDLLCRWMARHFDELDHPHADLVDKDALMARTGYHLIGKFPGGIKALAVERLKAAGR